MKHLEGASQERKEWYKEQSDLKRANKPALADDLPIQKAKRSKL